MERTTARASTLLTAAFIATLSAVSAPRAQTRPSESFSQYFKDSPDLVLAGHPDITASLERIAQGSALWRAEVEALRATGRKVVVVTPRQVLVADPGRGRQRAFDSAVLADVSLLPGGKPGVAAVVVVNLELLDDLHARRGSAPIQKADDLDRILIHEIYGHAFPYVRAGHRSGACADPAPGQKAEYACSIRRENAVREELGLGRRTDYGLRGLTIGELSLDQLRSAIRESR